MHTSSRFIFATLLVFALASPALAANFGGSPDDHFMCYRAHVSQANICKAGAPNAGAACTSKAECGGVLGACVKNRFKGANADLKDAFDPNGVAHNLRGPRRLCISASANGASVVDAGTQLVGYRAKRKRSGQPEQPKVSGLTVVNKFGRVELDTIRVDEVRIPANQDLNNPTSAPDADAIRLDHYKCHRVRETPGSGPFSATTAQITDPFEDTLYDVKKPWRLCAPMDQDGAGFKNSLGYQLCYKVRPAPGQPGHTKHKRVHTTDEFGPLLLNTFRADEVCVPSVVFEPNPECEVLNQTECYFPYPSTGSMTAAATETGLRISLPASGAPPVNGPPISVGPLYDRVNGRDGFAPMVPILMHFPQGVDFALSNASRLLEPGCCGQLGGPPWIETRTHTDRSRDVDSPTLLIDTETGERILHWVESDERGEGGDRARQAFIMRAGVSLQPGRRYIVAARNLKTPTGHDVEAEYPFASLRDGNVTPFSEIENRRQYFDVNIFPVLATAGVDRSELVLAFDFVTASEDQLSGQMLSMREQAYSYLDGVDADPNQIPFTVAKVVENDCNAPNAVVFRNITGKYDSPYFLDSTFNNIEPQYLNVDANNTPVQNGFVGADYTITIPCNALDPNAGPPASLVLGHGLFQTGNLITALLVPIAGSRVPDWNFVTGATDWRGLSSPDLVWVGGQVLGFGASNLHQFPTLPDRLSQGMLNTLVLSRMMKLGVFNRDPAFQLPGAGGAFPAPEDEMFYWGISLGGIMGTWFSALNPDIERFALDVPAANFACLLQRSSQFNAFETLIAGIGLTDPMHVLMGLSIFHEIWSSAEPAGYLNHITSDPLPGSGDPAHVAYIPVFLDKQVSNQCTEIAARTMNLPNVEGSIMGGMVDIPDVVGPVDSGIFFWDLGSFDIFDPLHEPFIPALKNTIPSGVCDPHPLRPTIPDAVEQLRRFMRPGGQLENTCDGLCDAGDPSEISFGAAAPCNPL